MASSDSTPKNNHKKRKTLNIKDTVTFTCTIDLTAPSSWEKFYSTPNNQHAFGFFFLPSATLATVNLILTDLSPDEKYPIQYRVSLLDSTGDKQLTFEYATGAPKDTFIAQKYIPYDVFQSFVRNNNNVCKVFVEVDVLEEIPSQCETKTDISADLGTLLETGKLSDMILSAGGKDFAVHKNILAARSPIFGALFEHSDIRDVQENRISIEDMSSDVCELMLKHIYTGSIPYDMNEYAFDLFIAADKYQLTQLKSACENALLSLLDINSVCTVLLLADGCNAVNLKSECIQFIIQNCNEVLHTEGWNEVSAKNALLVELFHKAAIKSSRQM